MGCWGEGEGEGGLTEAIVGVSRGWRGREGMVGEGGGYIEGC